MRYLVSLGVLFALGIVAPLGAQTEPADSGHVYVLTYWKTLPGQDAAYNTFMKEHSYPYYDELLKRGPMVSYRFLAVGAGSWDYTRLFIAEYEDWDSVDDGVSAEVIAEVCQAAFGMACADHVSNYPPLGEMRVIVRTEVLYSVR